MARTPNDASSLFAGNAAGTLRLVFYLALAMVLMVLDHRDGWLWRARAAASAVVEPVYRLAGLPSAGVRSLTIAFADRKLLTEQNQRLREDLLLANARLNRMASVAEQNERLKDLLDTQHSLELNVQLARVVGVDLGAYQQRLVINLGARDGVHIGQPVIDARGVIGQVVQILPTTAIVMLVTDPVHAIPVVDERSGLRTVAFGARDGDGMVLPQIPLAADVRAGDRLLTSGLGGRFPPGFPVGKVTAIGTGDSGLFRVAQVAPAADIDRADDVLLLHDQAEPMGPPAPAVPAGPPASLASPGMPAVSASTSASPAPVTPIRKPAPLAPEATP